MIAEVGIAGILVEPALGLLQRLRKAADLGERFLEEIRSASH